MVIQIEKSKFEINLIFEILVGGFAIATTAILSVLQGARLISKVGRRGRGGGWREGHAEVASFKEDLGLVCLPWKYSFCKSRELHFSQFVGTF